MPKLVIQTARPIADLADELRRTALSLDPAVIVERIRSGRDWFGDVVAEPRHRTLLIGSLSALALLLTLVGIFGVTAYAVARRTQEIGVRMAFGARPGQVVGGMIADAAWPMLLGICAGLAGAYFATRLIESFLYDTTPHDVPTFAAVALFMAITALVAAWIPARRAAGVDPVAALRAE
jgi:putative ABC transport system permease protein